MSRHISRAFVALVLVAGAAAAQPPAYRVEATDRQKVRAVIIYEIRTKQFAASRWEIFLPEPPELPSQGRVKVAADPPGKVVAEKSGLARPVRFLELAVGDPAPGNGVSMKLEVEAVLRSRKLVERAADEKPPAVAPLAAAERTYYLSATPHIDHEAKAFRAWLDAKKLRRADAESAIDLAARVLEVLRADYRYHFDADQDRRASAVCRVAATDCGGMTYLLVGALRANGVPARALVGRLARPRRPGSTPADTGYDQPHIRAELFVEGVGWVPVDPAYANARKARPAREFVGFDPGDLLVLHTDVDFRLPFPEKARECQLLQVSPYYWATGKGTFDAAFGPSGWEVRTTPIEKK